jgi:hypothetical protein
MPTPKGNLVTPIGFTDAGELLAWLVTNAGVLRVYIEGGTVTVGTHNLLDGDIHPDTIAGNPVEGDIIVGIDQGAGQIKWQRLARGATGQVPTVQADGSIAYASGGGGTVIQIVNTQTGAVATGTTAIPYDDTIPQNTEGDQYMTLAITPTDVNSNLRIDVVIVISHSVVSVMPVALFQDATVGALAAVMHYFDHNAGFTVIKFSHVMAAGTTSATTFKVRAGGSTAGTTTFNGQLGARKLGGVLASSITITEYTP